MGDEYVDNDNYDAVIENVSMDDMDFDDTPFEDYPSGEMELEIVGWKKAKNGGIISTKDGKYYGMLLLAPAPNAVADPSNYDNIENYVGIPHKDSNIKDNQKRKMSIQISKIRKCFNIDPSLPVADWGGHRGFCQIGKDDHPIFGTRFVIKKFIIDQE